VRTLLFDANSIAYWRHFSRLKNPEKPDAAQWIAEFVESTPHDTIRIVEDSKTNWRTSIHPTYKQHRAERPFEVTRQLHTSCATSLDGCEADDVIGQYCADHPDDKIIIVASDKDYHQCVTENVLVYDPVREMTYDIDAVVEKWGCGPDRIRALLAIMGDASDNIPGVPGLGKKRAAQVCDNMTWDQILSALDCKDTVPFEDCGLSHACADMLVTFGDTVIKNYELTGLKVPK